MKQKQETYQKHVGIFHINQSPSKKSDLYREKVKNTIHQVV
jgi:hypothetical protein